MGTGNQLAPKRKKSKDGIQPNTPRSEAGSRPQAPFQVVGIGASAGGLEACREFLSQLPDEPGMAVVIIQHLDPQHQSIMAELLSRSTRLPVVQVSESTRVRRNHVYVIPPNADLVIQDGTLQLKGRAPGRHTPIDTFLISLAKDQKNRAAGVILSGTATDGTLGLMAIKREGGITFAQDDTAKFDGMPRSAIAAGAVDFVFPPDRIARELIAIGRHPAFNHSGLGLDAKNSQLIDRLIRALRDYSGVDFSQYRHSTFETRVRRRMVLEKCASLPQYLEALTRRPALLNALFEDMLITVTEFFHDPLFFEALKRVAFPAILQNRNPADPVRIWVPGCANGEEVYSIAICLMEYLEANGKKFPCQIFGTDISQTAIDKARAGVYSSGAFAGVSPERLRKFFCEIDSGYQISRDVRRFCIFSRQNIVRDPPLGRLDLICCRDLLTDFGPQLQSKLVRVYRRALKPAGCLILASGEQPEDLDHGFTALDPEQHIYCRNSDTLDSHLQLPAHTLPVPPRAPSGNPAAGRRSAVQAYVERLLLNQYGPSGLLVDKSFRIVGSFGNAEAYLEPSWKDGSPDLRKVVNEDLALHLSAALDQAAKNKSGFALEGIPVRDDAKGRRISIEVRPIMPPGADQHYLILFQETAGRGPRQTKARLEKITPVQRSDLRAQTSRLSQELEGTRDYLESIIEQLRSANEEIQSSNEELMSTNEELQTTQEELQSSNEELRTINEEMEGRNEELRLANNDLTNLLTSMRIPLVMLSDDLRIRRFTPSSEQILHLLATDVGRPVSDLQPRINVPNLEEIIRSVIHTLAPHEQEVRDVAGRWYVLRVRPYRTAENRIEGAVLQLLDIDQLKRSLDETRQARDYAETIVDTIWEPLLVLDRDLRVLTANPSFHQTFRIGPGEAAGKGIYEIGGGQWDFPKMHDLLDDMHRSKTRVRDVEIEHTFDGIGNLTLQLNARHLAQNGGTGLILLAVQDVTDRKRAAEARYRQLFESAQDGIVIVDAGTGEITDVNPFALELFGYSREEMVGRNFLEIEPLREVAGTEASLRKVRSGKAVRFPDWPLITKDGRSISAEVIANAYQESNREMIQFNIRDITQRKKFEMQLQHSQKLESLGLLAGGIAHDFNNLLTGIMGNASLGMVETPAEAGSRKYFRDIIQSAERAADLTRQMLAYAGKGRFVVKPVNVSQLIREVGSLIRTSIPKQVDVQMELHPDLPMVQADAAQLQQLVMNLVINGAEAIGEQPGTVAVRTGVRDVDAQFVQEYPPGEPIPPGRYVCVEVTDTGAGMDEATKARIFDPFFTTKFTGRGLGLAAAVGIVRSHKGAMRVSSTPGRGSTFEFLLPASEALPPGVRPRKLENLRGSGTILFVDDEEALRKLARDALELYGYEVLLAENGKVAVDLFKENQNRIALIVLDMTMPVMGGKAALDRLKAIRPDIPVVLSSGYDQSEAAAKFVGKDLAGFVQKPYPVERLLECLADVLRPSVTPQS